MRRLLDFLFPAPKADAAPIHFTNTLSGAKELFVPLRPGKVAMYSCGPTVYGPQHVGNLRAAVFSDTVARVLENAGYKVRRVINITDVGHLVGDGDEGEDKMAVGARTEKTTPEQIARKYTERYLGDIKALNINLPSILFPRATEYIEEQIALITELEKKGLTYRTDDGVYFDTGAFPSYGRLGDVKKVALKEGARVKRVEGKRGPHDFALWRYAKQGDLQKWQSPWGIGNPGWSIECSTMAMALLGETIDIHTGGQDHITVHHNNEIAQSEGATGKPFAHFWLHNAFLTIDGTKISKSIGNVHTLTDVMERGFHPLSLRYFFLQAHYRTPQSFTWDALAAAHEALERLWRLTYEAKEAAHGKTAPSEMQVRLIAIIRDDLATPQALALLWDALKDEDLSPAQLWGVIEAADGLLGLSLVNPPEVARPLTLAELPAEVRTLAEERIDARRTKNYALADELRIHIENRGYAVNDGGQETLYIKQKQ